MTQLSFLPYEPPNKYTSALNALQAHERPSYRAATAPSACTTLELLAAVIGGPRQIETAQKVLEKFITLREIHNARVEEFQEISGVGKSTAERIKASVGLGLRVLTDSPSHASHPTITSPIRRSRNHSARTRHVHRRTFLGTGAEQPQPGSDH